MGAQHGQEPLTQFLVSDVCQAHFRKQCLALLSRNCPRVPLARLSSTKEVSGNQGGNPLHQTPQYFCGAHANHLLPSPLVTKHDLFVPVGKCTDAAHF